MKRSLNEVSNGDPAFDSISLQLLLNKLVSDLPGSMALNQIVVENEVSSDLKMIGDQRDVVPVIDELLSTVVANARNTCIHITAEKFSDIVTLNFEDRNNYNGYALAFSLMVIGQHARFVGGDINIKGAQKRVATVSFSFPDTPGIRRCTC